MADSVVRIVDDSSVVTVAVPFVQGAQALASAAQADASADAAAASAVSASNEANAANALANAAAASATTAAGHAGAASDSAVAASVSQSAAAASATTASAEANAAQSRANAAAVSATDAAASAAGAIGPARILAGKGLVEELFAGVVPTVTNITDAAAVNATVTTGVNGMTIVSNLTGSRTQMFTTPLKVGGSHSRLVFTITPTVMASSAGVGLAFISGGTRTTVIWSNIGRLTTVVLGGATVVQSTFLPTFVAGDVLTMQFDLTPAGNLYVRCSKNGGAPVVVGIASVPVADIAIVQQVGTAGTSVTYRADLTSVSTVAASVADASAFDLLPTGSRAALAIAEQFAAFYRRTTPTGFVAPRVPSWFKVYKHPGGRSFFTTMDLQPVLSEDDPTVATLYVDIAAGLDTNDGTSAAPLKSINYALSRCDVGSRCIVKAKGGLYDFANSWKSQSPLGAVIQVMSSDGLPVISSMHDAGLTWTLGTSSTYSATFTLGVVNVFDAANLTADGDYGPLTLAASQAACEATANSYFVTGTTIYVHTFNNRAPDASIRVYKKAASGTANDTNAVFRTLGGTLYLQDVHFEGGNYPLYSAISSSSFQQNIYARRCNFKYAGLNNIALNGDALFLSQECITARAKSDGYNYHAIFGSVGATAIEVGNIGRWNGTDTSGTNNGSTNHEAGKTIRVNCSYPNNQDRNVHDIGGAHSWLLGVTSGPSQTGDANFAAGVSTDAGGTVSKMWLDTCTSVGGALDLETPGIKGEIYTYDLVSSGSNVVGTVVAAYTP